MNESATKQHANTKMKYFVCDKGGSHDGQFLNLICIESSCTNKGLICSICKAESHDKHRVFPMRMFLEEIDKHNVTTETSQLSRILQSLQNNKSEVLNALQLVVEKLAESVKKVEENVLRYYASIQREILGKVKVIEDLDVIVKKLVKSQYSNDKLAKSDLLRVVSNIKTQSAKQKDANSNLQIDADFDAILNETTSVNGKLHTEVEKLKQYVQEFAVFSDSVCKNNTVKKVTSNIFSKDNKATEIEVSPDLREAKKINHDLPKIILCDAPLHTGLNKISFKIKKFSNWIAVGLGLFSKIKERSFSFQGSMLGHGTFMLSNNGMTWSHTQTDQNSVKKGFTFTTNDILEVEHLTRTDIVRIRKLNSESSIELRVNIPTTEQLRVYFCVTLGGIGDTVQIIN